MIPRRDVTDHAERHAPRVVEEVAAERRHGVLVRARHGAEIPEPFRQPRKLRRHLAARSAGLVDLDVDKLRQAKRERIGGPVHQVTTLRAR